jgi:Raf kinase inhibitor-like YbhB/YbcL family protein
MMTQLFAIGVRFGPGTARLSQFVLCLVSLATLGCWHDEPFPADDPALLTIKLGSPAFAAGGTIPKEYTCDGADRSPPLEWSGVPQSTHSLTLICDDPDAPMGTWSHWVVIHLPAGVKGLKEGVPAEKDLPVSAMETPENDPPRAPAIQGTNDFGKVGYGGPCPPSGTHRYVFRLFALDQQIELGSSLPTRSEVLKAIKSHILAEGRLVGSYAR